MPRDVLGDGFRSGNCSCHDAAIVPRAKEGGGGSGWDALDCLGVVSGRQSVNPPGSHAGSAISDNGYYVYFMRSGVRTGQKPSWQYTSGGSFIKMTSEQRQVLTEMLEHLEAAHQVEILGISKGK